MKCHYLALLLLSACTGGPLQRYVDQQTPPVMAVNGGSAELTLQACPSTITAKDSEAIFHQLIATLQGAGIMVTANGGTAKLTIDMCPQ